MNNNEYLNTLSVDEKVKELQRMVLCDGCERNNECFDCDGQCSEHFKFWLEAEHKTTGHEDLVNAGWKPWDSDEQSVYYEKGSRRIRILRYGYNHYCGEDYVQFDDEEVDFIRKCADKIRKEKGWA